MDTAISIEDLINKENGLMRLEEISDLLNLEPYDKYNTLPRRLENLSDQKKIFRIRVRDQKTGNTVSLYGSKFLETQVG